MSDLPSYPQEAADREAAQQTGQDGVRASGRRRLIGLFLILGGTLAAALGLLMIGLGALGGLARNPAGGELMEDGYVVLTFGALALATGFVTRHRRRT